VKKGTSAVEIEVPYHLTGIINRATVTTVSEDTIAQGTQVDHLPIAVEKSARSTAGRGGRPRYLPGVVDISVCSSGAAFASFRGPLNRESIMPNPIDGLPVNWAKNPETASTWQRISRASAVPIFAYTKQKRLALAVRTCQRRFFRPVL
jgi:hypothetical protein